MPRKPRFFLPAVPVHVVQRGHNREAVFFEESDYHAYLNWLGEAAIKYQCSIHAYCLMTNHIHLLVSPAASDGVTRLMQFVGRYYVPYINHKYGRSGSIWEGRYKASLIDADDYLLACMRYIELNPVAANMVPNAELYAWSSYRCNALGIGNNLIQPHELYRTLGKGQKRFDVYLSLFSAHQDDISKINKEIAASSQTGTPLGNDGFRTQIERALGQKTGQARRGRPSGFVLTEESKESISSSLKAGHQQANSSK